MTHNNTRIMETFIHKSTVSLSSGVRRTTVFLKTTEGMSMCVHIYIYAHTYTPYRMTEHYGREISRSTAKLFKGIPNNLMYADHSKERSFVSRIYAGRKK